MYPTGTRIALERQYTENWSLLIDLKIILKNSSTGPPIDRPVSLFRILLGSAGGTFSGRPSSASWHQRDRSLRKRELGKPKQR